MVQSSDILKLLEEQKKEWTSAHNNFEALSSVKTKEFSFNNFVVRIQFNPARIQSTAAKVDTKSIQERKCFLCNQNLPSEQRGLPFGKNYTILVNPFPIFPEHFTIPTNNHIDQLVEDKYSDMLDLAKALDKFTIFYNGPKCGASAPDHAHFQAGNQGFMPLEQDIEKINKELIFQDNTISTYILNNYFRNTIFIKGTNKTSILNFFKFLYSKLEIKEGEKEPMMNIVTWYKNNNWLSCIFPREKHRPACFYADKETNILISPASVDMGGVFITPQEKDFNKITKKDIENIFKEVSLPLSKTTSLNAELKQYNAL